MCVRTCDGFYWPISFSVPRNALHRDSDICKSSCATEARLFYQPKSESDVQSMTDLSGRAYSRLPTAYQYRKTLVSGCSCKPEPWSPSELDRHRQYAAALEPAAKAAKPDGTGDAQLKPEAVADAVPEKSQPGSAKSSQVPAEKRLTDDKPPLKVASLRSGTTAPTAAPAKPLAVKLDRHRRQAEAPQPAVRRQAAPERSAQALPSVVTPPLKQAASRPPRAITPMPVSGYALGGPKLRWPGD